MNFTILRSYQKKIKKRKNGSHQQLNCVKKNWKNYEPSKRWKNAAKQKKTTKTT